MGIARGFVRSVFSKNRSPRTQEITNASSSEDDRKAWSSVRSLLCGDEFNSVLAEEDSDSIKNYDTTVMQPMPSDDYADKGAIESEEPAGEARKEISISASELFRQEDAALVIQTAFRNFLARRQIGEIKLEEDQQEPDAGTQSPSRDSVGTSVEVQTGNSIEVLSTREESSTVHCQMQKKQRVQMSKLKEDWDDSTVSNSISKMRLQHKLEATNRRERALAYAFAQQLRICSRTQQTRTSKAESSMSWSWLERWMATRMPETSGKQLEPPNCSSKLALQKRLLDVAIEEKESCGSNEMQLDRLSLTSANGRDAIKPTKTRVNRLKATRTISRRQTVPSYQYHKHDAKVIKERSKEIDQAKEHESNQPSCKGEDQPHESSISLATIEVATSNT